MTLQEMKMRMHILKTEYVICGYRDFEKQRSILKESIQLNKRISRQLDAEEGD